MITDEDKEYIWHLINEALNSDELRIQIDIDPEENTITDELTGKTEKNLKLSWQSKETK